MLAACFIATGLNPLCKTTAAEAFTHLPNIKGHVQTHQQTTKTRKQLQRDASLPAAATASAIMPTSSHLPSKHEYAEVTAPTRTDVELVRYAGSISWARPASCLNGTLKGVLHDVSKFGNIHVTSTCRSREHNRRVGGAPHSHHIGGNAVDFYVRGNYGAAKSYLRSHGSVGGLKHYGGGRFHIDTGPRRSF